jgi:hypothetical protein
LGELLMGPSSSELGKQIEALRREQRLQATTATAPPPRATAASPSTPATSPRSGRPEGRGRKLPTIRGWSAWWDPDACGGLLVVSPRPRPRPAGQKPTRLRLGTEQRALEWLEANGLAGTDWQPPTTTTFASDSPHFGGLVGHPHDQPAPPPTSDAVPFDAPSTIERYLDLLQIHRGAQLTTELVKQKWRDLAMPHHPDQGGNQVMFEMLTAARDALLEHMQQEQQSEEVKPETIPELPAAE